MNTNNSSSSLYLVVALVSGIVLGLVYGYLINPVEWTGAGYNELHPDQKDSLIHSSSDLLRLSNNDVNLVRNRLLPNWQTADAMAAVCDLHAREVDGAARANLDNLARALGNQDCPQFVASGGVVNSSNNADTGGAVADPSQGSGRNPGAVLTLLLILVLLAAIIYMLMRRRSELMSDAEGATFGEPLPDAPPTTSGDEDITAVPLARFQSAYNIGRDNYDDSFSIENSSGDFLGECGVGISESIGTGAPKNVTAFEVWLFDKNDIRTVTKVVMSEHAFYDDALKAKLAPKGEPVRAVPNEVIILETASLIINATVKTINYGVGGTLPPESFFDSFTVELSAWAKEGSLPETDVAGRIDALDF